MDWFAQQGFDTWTMDNEGYGRSDKHRPINSDISNGADDLEAGTEYVRKSTGAKQLLMYGISSGALKAALFAQRNPGVLAKLALDAFVWTRKAAPRWSSGARSCPSSGEEPAAADRAFVHSIFNRDHPGTADEATIEAFARDPHAGLLAAHRHLRGHVLELPVCDPEKIGVPTLILRGEWDGIASMEDLLAFFQQAAEHAEAVQRDARHLARELPAEELHDGLPDPACLLHAAGSRLHGVMP